MKYTRYAVEAIVDKVLRDLRIDSGDSLDILTKLRERMILNEKFSEQLEKQMLWGDGTPTTPEEVKAFWDDKKAMVAEDVL